jgi:osmoprotectant transport system substrate-binding protein
MRSRARILVPLALTGLLLTACGESGSSGTGGAAASGGSASGDACAPVAGEQLVVLEDDQHLQNADNVVPAVNMAAAQANPALLPALDAVSAALTTQELVDLNAAVDLERQSAEDVAAAWVEENIDAGALQQGSGPITVGGANFTESTVLANVYADVLDAAGFDASVREVGNRELYLPALISGSEIQVFPEYLATLTETLNRQANGPNATQDKPVASGDPQETLAGAQPLVEQVGLVLGEPSEAADGGRGTERAAVEHQRLAGDPAGAVAEQVGRGLADVLGHAEPAHRVLRRPPRPPGPRTAPGEAGLHHRRRDRVDPHRRAELHGQLGGQVDQRGLAHAVGGDVLRGPQPGHRGDDSTEPPCSAIHARHASCTRPREETTLVSRILRKASRSRSTIGP